MNIWPSLLIVAVTAISTLATRALPFILFGNKKRQVSEPILYLGRVLPPAVMAILVVYSLKDISFGSAASWANPIICVAVTAAVHLLRRNTLLSIGIGTVCYMVVVQGAFF